MCNIYGWAQVGIIFYQEFPTLCINLQVSVQIQNFLFMSCSGLYYSVQVCIQIQIFMFLDLVQVQNIQFMFLFKLIFLIVFRFRLFCSGLCLEGNIVFQT